MSELGGPAESFTPDEGGGSASEQLSEEALARFTANANAMKEIRREEKQSKKKDDQVAQVIIQFLGDKKYAHLFVLISRLVARDCPSIFILAIISLIHEESLQKVQEHIQLHFEKSASDKVDESLAVMKQNQLDADTNKALVDWITRMQMILSLEPDKILLKLMLDEKNIDGTVLQLTTFVLQDFFKQRDKSLPFEKIQPLTAGILQAVFEPFLGPVRQILLQEKAKIMKDMLDED